jgi:hypothetical protein
MHTISRIVIAAIFLCAMVDGRPGQPERRSIGTIVMRISGLGIIIDLTQTFPVLVV